MRIRLYSALDREVGEFERQSKILKLVVKLVGPTVVHIETEKDDKAAARLGSRRLVEEAGSGVIIQLKDAFYILTNWHVIKDAKLNNIQIRLSDGRQITPTNVWNDVQTDVAVMAMSAPAGCRPHWR